MSMTAVQQLSSILQSELNTSSQLAQLLKVERQALKNVDISQINDITKQKQPLVIQLEQLGRQREMLLKNNGFPADKSGIEAFIANQDVAEAAKLSQLLKQLGVQARLCHDGNQVNGGIVNVNRQYLVRAMSVLRGRDPETAAYGPGGEYTSQVVRQPLIGRV